MFEFHAMGTEITLSAPELGAAGEWTLARQVVGVFAVAEARFSRFLPSSELSRLNRAVAPVRVSAELFAALRRARRYVDLTAGLFDPAIGGALVACGYDRPLALGLDCGRAAAPSAAARFSELELDPESRTVFRPHHLQLDLGGMIKGHTVDCAAALLPAAGFVDAGGDAALRGAERWEVEIEDPHDPERVVGLLRIRDRAVATSAANRRRWSVGGRSQHHLIDPRTARPGSSDLAQATVIAETTELADVLAKTAFLLGRERAVRFLKQLEAVGAVLVGEDGALTVVGDAELHDA
jgi:thiamine biosynthesis lipoprotein